MGKWLGGWGEKRGEDGRMEGLRRPCKWLLDVPD